ncbi:MAG TPA: hypothetical protein VLT47_00245 [Anaeromyxobacteraceae bacterium]|nr:hypothetical protein [Anaeromyxobacteraceae bacterium]
MFTREGVDELLDLQRRSYALLQWVNDRVQAGTLRVDAMHGSLDAASAAAEWLKRNAATLPTAARPPEGKLEWLGHLFASYLTTSFELRSVKRVSDGCPCGFCTYLVAAPNLRARTPSGEDRRLARQLQLDLLEELAAEEGLALFREELQPLLQEARALGRPLAMVTWVRELSRRAAFRGQGSPVLALWREFAWKGARPDRRFELTTDAVLEAEELVQNALRAMAR